MKYATLLFVSLAILISAVMVLLYDLDYEEALKRLGEKENQHVSHLSESLTADLQSIVIDLQILSQLNEFEEFFQDSEKTLPLSKEYLVFGQTKERYSQIRYLDIHGMEKVRVNRDNGRAFIVPKSELQNKSHRYYFKEALALEKGKFYISPFDLNIERGELEMRSMIRFATPVFDKEKNKRGVVIINYNGEKLLETLRHADRDMVSRCMLLNQGGYWLHSPNRRDEWGFMFQGRKDLTFDQVYPDEWNGITSFFEGNFVTERGNFTFTTVYPLKFGKGFDKDLVSGKGPIAPQDYYWILVSRLSPETLQSLKETAKRKRLLHWATALLILAITIYGGAYFLRKKQVALFASRLSPAYLLTVTVLSVFLGEGGLMLLLHHQPGLSTRVMGLFDALALTLLLTPIFYIFIFQPILYYRSKGEQAEIDKKAAENSNRIKDEFLASISHELRSPLTSVIGFAERIPSKIKKGQLEKAEKFSRDIGTSANFLLALINDILDYTKIEAGAIVLHKETFFIKDLVDQLKSQLNYLVEKKGLKLNIEISDNSSPVYADRIRFIQIIMNLFTNAVKFTEKGGTVKIIATTKNQLHLFVSDTGEGISEEDQHSIFERFKQVGRNVKEQQGTGLGLAITKRLVELHGGRIEVKSHLNKGTTFMVSIPIKEGGEDCGREREDSGR